MALYILDTTTITLLQRRHPRLDATVLAHSADDIAITSINIEEFLGGWFSMLRRSKTNADQAKVYLRIATAVMFLARWPVLSVTETALNEYDRLLKQKLNIGRMDLKIAALALELGATIVTNNVRDFSRVPGLVVEDWTQ